MSSRMRNTFITQTLARMAYLEEEKRQEILGRILTDFDSDGILSNVHDEVFSSEEAFDEAAWREERILAKQKELGINPNAPVEFSDEMTPAVNTNMVDNEGTQNKLDKRGNSRLHKAVIDNDADEARKLIRAGYSTSQQNNDGKTPVEIATYEGAVEILQMFQEEGVFGCPPLENGG